MRSFILPQSRPEELAGCLIAMAAGLILISVRPVDRNTKRAIVIGGGQDLNREIIVVCKLQIQAVISHSRVAVDRQIACAFPAVGPAVVDLDVRQLNQQEGKGR